MDRSTAILFFSYSAGFEATRKNWTRNGSTNLNKQIADSLIRHQRKVIQQTNFACLQFDEKNQRGATFGERLANAAESLFSSGYEQLIIVGNDCLQLDHKIFESTDRLLEQNDLVLGPTRNGGTYLIGIRKVAFDKRKFTNLLWETSGLFHDIQKYVEEMNLDCFELRQYSDVNDSNALEQLLRSTNILINFKLGEFGFLLNTRSSFSNLITSLSHQILTIFIARRGPPSAVNACIA